MSAPHTVLKKLPSLAKRTSLGLAALIAALPGGIWRAQSSNRCRVALVVPAVVVGSAG
jgi:hypothetical protein